ncbi:hypothetical protein BU14_2130s0001 [Porphyra umbilicalis]|uniref:Ribosome maturation protein SDO1/SBDS N-terminal domain-containing protein n=1 Tax=Porphyra umbilicalis TaxID=2786 RepID=A0A1X6NJU9_PORUM|nr:hypothetical protein BU14_2130s0001 [Porphyra umbilicalis]|eukprot:OSX68884.1 hypothetical protein BU14_2130s0001 [Porphyra umbilicalis]
MLVRRKVGKTTFELLTHEGAAAKYRAGDLSSIDDVVVTDTVFTNQSKGQRASQDQLTAAFGEDATPASILKAIISKGDLQTSAAERTAKADQRRREVLEHLTKYYVDPSRNLPIPLTRFENALTQIKARIDDRPADRQAEELVRKLVDVMPMRKLTMEGVLRVPHAHLGAAAGVIIKHAKINREGHEAGGVKYDISVVPGAYDGLMSALAKATKGDFTFELDGQPTRGVATSESDPAEGESSGRRGGSGRKGKGGRGGGDADRGRGGGVGRGRGGGGRGRGGGGRGRGGKRAAE